MNIYEALKKDHVAVKELLDQLVSLEDGDNYREILVNQIKDELIPHARAEESVFYNSIRAVNPDTEVMHSFAEHMKAETLLRSLQVEDAIDIPWKTTAEKLREAIEHHIAEEEGQIFSEARNLFSEQETEMMGDAFEALKEEQKKQGFMKNSLDMVINMMPPRFIEQLRNI